MVSKIKSVHNQNVLKYRIKGDRNIHSKNSGHLTESVDEVGDMRLTASVPSVRRIKTFSLVSSSISFIFAFIITARYQKRKDVSVIIPYAIVPCS